MKTAQGSVMMGQHDGERGGASVPHGDSATQAPYTHVPTISSVWIPSVLQKQ